MGVRRAGSSASAAQGITTQGFNGSGREGERSAWRGRRDGRAALAVAVMALIALNLGGCSLGFGGSGSDSGVAGQSLNTLPWCDQPLVSFIDDSQPTAQPSTDWTAVKGTLGFTPYLPATLPKGSCLDLVGGTVHDPVFGGHLSVTWVLPQTGSLSLSEAPKRNVAAGSLQCAQAQALPGGSGSDSAQTPTATTSPSTPTTICIGAQGDTAVTIAAHLPESQVRDYFNQLQSNADWAPVGPSPVPTATTTPSTTATPGQ